jgi:glycosyl transferase, family 25
MIAYVINLDRSSQRWAHMTAMLAARSLPFSRVTAVDGRRLAQDEVDRLAPAAPGRRLTRTEVACAESHRRAWAAIAEAEHHLALVLEDDVFLSPSFVEGLHAIAAALPPEAAFVKLNNSVKPICLSRAPVATVGCRALHRLPARTVDASAYLVTREAARSLLARFPPYPEEVDLLLFDPSNGLPALQAVPALSVQQQFADFAFLPAAAPASLLTAERTEARAERRKLLALSTLPGKLTAELRRFARRRLHPFMLTLANHWRPPAERIAFRRVPFIDI